MDWDSVSSMAGQPVPNPWDAVSSTAAQPLATPTGPLGKIAASPLGQQFDAATNAGANLLRPFFGQPQVNDTPDLDALKAKGWANLTTPQKVGAVEDALMASPTGQIAAAAGGTVMNVPTWALSKLNQGLEAAGLPRQYSQAAEMLLPLAKGLKSAPEAAPAETSAAPAATPAETQPASPTQATPAASVPAETPQPPPPPASRPEIPQKAWDNAHEILRSALEEEGLKPEDVATALDDAGRTGLPLAALDVATKDVGGVRTQGRNLLGLADAAANMPGKGAAMAGDLAARGYDAKARIGKAFDDNISGNKYYDVRADAVQDQEGAGPLYDEAYAANQNVQSPQVDRILQTPAGQQALKAAAVKMQNDMTLMGVNDPELAEQAQLTGQYQPGDGGVASGLKLRSLDYVKRALDDQIGSAQRAGEGDNVRILSGLKNNLTNALDEADATKLDAPPPLQPGMTRLYRAEDTTPGQMPAFTTRAAGATGYVDIPSTKASLGRLVQGDAPDKFYTAAPEITGGTNPVSAPGKYAQARQAYATAARQKDALELGRKFTTLDPEEIAQYLGDKNRSTAEKSAFATGVRRALQDKMGNVGDNANAVTALWKDNVRDRLRPLFQTQGDFDNFSKLMQHEQAMARVNGMMTRGSQTNMRGNYQEQLAAKKTPTAAAIAKTVIEPQGALANKVGDMMTEALQKRAKGMSQDTAAAVMHYLTARDPKAWHALAEEFKPGPTAAGAIRESASGPRLVKYAAAGAANNALTEAQKRLQTYGATPGDRNAPEASGAASAGTGAGAGGETPRLRSALSALPSLVSDASAAEEAPPLVDRIARAESGGRPNARNPNSTASGPLQFTDGTWARMVAKYGKQAGIALGDKNDPAAQRVMGQLLAQENARSLSSRLGRPPTDGEVYAAHILGAHDALRLISAAANSPGRQAVTLYPRKLVADNRGLFFDGRRPRTALELYGVMNSKVS